MDLRSKYPQETIFRTVLMAPLVVVIVSFINSLTIKGSKDDMGDGLNQNSVIEVELLTTVLFKEIKLGRTA